MFVFYVLLVPLVMLAALAFVCARYDRPSQQDPYASQLYDYSLERELERLRIDFE